VADLLVKHPCSRTHSHSDGTHPDVGKVHRVVTTLRHPLASPALQRCLLSQERWEIEVTSDETKTHLRISQSPVLSHLPKLALQERSALLLTHDAIGAVMVRAAQSQGQLDPDRLSFPLAVQSMQDVVLLMGHQRSACQVERVLPHLSALLGRKACLVHPGRLRFTCRVVKRICPRFRRKRPHHLTLPLPHTRFSDILLL
jgi:hypothetical protein